MEKHRHSCFLMLLVLLSLSWGSGVWAQQTAAVSITKLLPADTAFVYAADTTRLAESVTKLQTIPLVSRALATVEKTLGISLQHDAIPWVGQLGFALLDSRGGKARALLLLEIRKQAAWQHTLPLLHSAFDKLTGLTSTTTSYAGVKLHTVPVLAWGQFGGWLVLGMGDSAIQHSIDAWQGKIPSLFANTATSKLMENLPTRHNGFFCVNGDSLAKLLAYFPYATKFNFSALQGAMLVGSLSDNAQGERIELIAYISSATQRQQLKALRDALTPVASTTLAQLPQGAFAEWISSHPAKYVTFLENTLRGCATDPDDQQNLEYFITHTQPLLQMFSNDSGACAAALSWTKEVGFGLSAVCETPSAQQATSQVNLLTTFHNSVLHIPVEVTDGVATIPTEIPYEEMLHAKVCWTAKDAWFKIGTARDLICGAGMKAAKLPPEALGADCVFMADLSFLSSLFDHFAARMVLDNVGALMHGHLATSEIPRDGMLGITALRLLGLDGMQILAYSRIADDGSYWHGVMELNHAPDVCGLMGLGPIITAAIFPAVNTYSEKALQKESFNNLRQLGKAVQMFLQDNDDKFPDIDIRACITVPAKVDCQPSSKLPYLPNHNLSGKSIRAFPDASAVVLFYEQTPYNDGGRYVCFLDGHEAYVTAKAWETLKVTAGIK